VLKLHERTEHVVTEELAKSEETRAGADPALRAGGIRHRGAHPRLNSTELRPIEALRLAGGIAEDELRRA
jgi:hypothetical protein